LHEIVFVVFQWVISRLWKPFAFFLSCAPPSLLKVVLVLELQLLIFILYPLFGTCNLSFCVACYFLPYARLLQAIFKTRMETWIWKKTPFASKIKYISVNV